jgi:hypothetical protein
MRPLGSPRVEYQLMGAIEMLAGVGFAIVAAVAGRPAAAVTGVVIGAVIFGGLMYLLVYRRNLRQAVESARSAPTTDRESTSRTWSRVGQTMAILLLILVVLSFLFHSASLPAGIVFGNGAAFLGLSAWLAKWERENGSAVLREPNRRWGVSGFGGGGRGRGIFDPRDFYLAEGQTNAPADGERTPRLG